MFLCLIQNVHFCNLAPLCFLLYFDAFLHSCNFLDLLRPVFLSWKTASKYHDTIVMYYIPSVKLVLVF